MKTGLVLVLVVFSLVFAAAAFAAVPAIPVELPNYKSWPVQFEEEWEIYTPDGVLPRLDKFYADGKDNDLNNLVFEVIPKGGGGQNIPLMISWIQVVGRDEKGVSNKIRVRLWVVNEREAKYKLALDKYLDEQLVLSEVK